MTKEIVLASGSEIRRMLMASAGLDFSIEPASIDERGLTDSLLTQSADPKDIALQLAKEKALAIARRHPSASIIGCDQVLAFQGEIFSKPTSKGDARAQLGRLNGQEHQLISAIAIVVDSRIDWSFAGQVSLQMRQNSPEYIDDYVPRNWNSIQHSVGAYKLEEEGVRLFERVQGDYFHVLGLPLLELLAYLRSREMISG